MYSFKPSHLFGLVYKDDVIIECTVDSFLNLGFFRAAVLGVGGSLQFHEYGKKNPGTNPEIWGTLHDFKDIFLGKETCKWPQLYRKTKNCERM